MSVVHAGRPGPKTKAMKRNRRPIRHVKPITGRNNTSDYEFRRERRAKEPKGRALRAAKTMYAPYIRPAHTLLI